MNVSPFVGVCVLALLSLITLSNWFVAHAYLRRFREQQQEFIAEIDARIAELSGSGNEESV